MTRLDARHRMGRLYWSMSCYCCCCRTLGVSCHHVGQCQSRSCCHCCRCIFERNGIPPIWLQKGAVRFLTNPALIKRTTIFNKVSWSQTIDAQVVGFDYRGLAGMIHILELEATKQRIFLSVTYYRVP